MIRVFKGAGGYDVAYTINGNNIYANAHGSGDVAYRIDGDKIYKGSGGYDVAYRLDSSDDKNNISDSEKPGCLGKIIGAILGAIVAMVMHSWQGRIGVAYGLAFGILGTIMQRGSVGMGIFLSVVLMLIFGALGLLAGFISSKLSRHGNLGALIGAAAIGIALAIIAAAGKQDLHEIILFFLFGTVPGLVVGAIVGGIVGLVKNKKTGKIES
jgi:integral membrane sensor domain MASE1